MIHLVILVGIMVIFVKPDDNLIKKKSLCYNGIYRFLNNPELVTGYLGYYGCALLCRSWTIFSLALLSQFLNQSFVNIVELPHMRKLYKDVREESGFTQALDKIKKRKILIYRILSLNYQK